MRLYTRPAMAVLLSLAPHVAFTQAARREHPPEPSSVAVQPEQFASDPSVRAYLAELLRPAGGGYRLTERAAFLVAADQGGYGCLLWPYHTAVQREVFRGRIPPRTIAVVHTHPNAIPRPSAGDRRESQRLGLPFIVVSARHIYAVKPTGEVAAIVENEWWSDGIERRQTERCHGTELPAASFQLPDVDLLGSDGLDVLACQARGGIERRRLDDHEAGNQLLRLGEWPVEEGDTVLRVGAASAPPARPHRLRAEVRTGSRGLFDQARKLRPRRG